MKNNAGRPVGARIREVLEITETMIQAMGSIRVNLLFTTFELSCGL